MAERFDAFLSYSHEDRPLAERLSRRLRGYRPPRGSGVERRRLRVFRDVERTTARPSLSRELAERLAASDHLVLLASRASAASSYVDEEVRGFLDGPRGLDAVIVALADASLEGALPPALAGHLRDPLFVDLGPQSRGRRRFREESLRVVAALYGVDYAALSREDERRRARTRRRVAAATLIGLLSLAAGWIVTTTPAEAWVERPIPVPPSADTMVPIDRMLVAREDPELLLFLGRNARYALEIVRTQSLVPDEGAAWLDERVGAVPAPEHDAHMRRVAELRLEIGEPPHARATVGFHALVDASGERWLYRSLEAQGTWTSRNGRAIEERLRQPPAIRASGPEPDATSTDWYRAGLDLELVLSPWPIGDLEAARLYERGEPLRGELVELGGDRALPLAYTWTDDYDAVEWAEVILAPEWTILSTRAPDELVIDVPEYGEPFPLAELENEPDLWEALERSDAWLAPERAERVLAETLRAEFVDEGHDLSPDAWELVRAHDPSLAEALRPALPGPAERYELALLRRDTPAGPAFAAQLVGHLDRGVEQPEPPRTAHLVRAPGATAWRPAALPPSARAIDLVVCASDAGPPALWLLTEREGLYRSRDAGRSWESGALGRPDLTGESVHLVAAGEVLWALHDRHQRPEEGENALYLHTRRGPLERLRAGLVELLGGSR